MHTETNPKPGPVRARKMSVGKPIIFPTPDHLAQLQTVLHEKTLAALAMPDGTPGKKTRLREVNRANANLARLLKNVYGLEIE